MFEMHLTITNSRGPMYSVLSRYKVVSKGTTKRTES